MTLRRQPASRQSERMSNLSCRMMTLDTLFGIKESTRFLAELKRLATSGGLLIIGDGHQSRQTTRKILASG